MHFQNMVFHYVEKAESIVLSHGGLDIAFYDPNKSVNNVSSQENIFSTLFSWKTLSYKLHYKNFQDVFLII